MKRSPINHYSLKKITEIQSETPNRISLCQRARGKPITQTAYLYRKGQKYPYTKVICTDGICEICGKQCSKLEPHEDPPKSKGAVVNLQFSKMACRECHVLTHNNYPKWSKGYARNII